MTEQKIFEDNNKFSVPEVIPILPLHNVLVFPKTMIPLEVSGSAAQLIDEAMIKDRLVGLVMTKKNRIIKAAFTRWKIYMTWALRSHPENG